MRPRQRTHRPAARRAHAGRHGRVPRGHVRPRARQRVVPRRVRWPRGRPRPPADRDQAGRRRGGPFPKVSIGLGMGAPTIATHGTDEQKAKWLRPLFSGEEIWCQLFSEPGAGSDVASLSTTARARRRRVGRQRPEGLDQPRPRGPLGDARGPHRPRRPQAPGPHLLHLRHARARRRRAPAAPDDRPGRVQRGVPHRRAHPRRAPHRRRGRRLAHLAHHPHERARRDRWRLLRAQVPRRLGPRAVTANTATATRCSATRSCGCG